jgi:hypothetical protein
MNMINQSPQPMTQSFNLISRDELKRLAWDEHLSDAEIARMYNVSTNQVNHKRRQMNLIQGEISTEQLSDIVRLAERVKSLPLAAINEIRAIVDQYAH